MSKEEMMKKIDDQVKNNKVMIFVKGTKEQPMCGFSAATMECFRALNVDFHTENVLADPELRPVLQEYSKWPTTPQVFIDGKFIGGCDITREMYANGDLKKLVEEAKA